MVKSHEYQGKGPYSAIVYIDGSRVVAEDAHGVVISSGTVGYDDASVINAALAARKHVFLADGTYTILDNITPPANSGLVGESNDKTILNFTSVRIINLNGGYNYIKNIKLTGKIEEVLITSSHILIEDVVATVDNSWIYTFCIWPSSSILDDIEFRNCAAIDCGRSGFWNEGDGTPNKITNLRYINCRVINCGLATRYDDWACGISLSEKCDLEDVHVLGGYATGCWESGLHCEGGNTLKNVIIEGFRSYNNAQKGATCLFGAGIVARVGMMIKGCICEANRYGILAENMGMRTPPLDIDVVTRDNTVAGILLGNAQNVKIEHHSYCDYDSLYLKNDIRNSDINLISVSAGRFGMNRRTDGSNYVENCKLNLKIYNPVGDTYDFNYLNNYKNCDFDIIYRGVSDKVNNLWFAEIDGCYIHVNSMPAGGSGVTVQIISTALKQNIITGRILGGVDGITFNNAGMAGIVVLKNLDLNNLNTGISLPSAISGTVIIDKKSINFDSVVTSINDASLVAKYITNSGSSTGTGSQQTIAHGLVVAPTHVSVVPTVTGASVTAVWADATNIYATVTSGKAYNWSAEV